MQLPCRSAKRRMRYLAERAEPSAPGGRSSEAEALGDTGDAGDSAAARCAPAHAAFAGSTKARSAPCLSTGSYRFTAEAVSDGNLLCYAVHVAVQRFLHLQRLVNGREHQLRVAVAGTRLEATCLLFFKLAFREQYW